MESGTPATGSCSSSLSWVPPASDLPRHPSRSVGPCVPDVDARDPWRQPGGSRHPALGPRKPAPHATVVVCAPALPQGHGGTREDSGRRCQCCFCGANCGPLAPHDSWHEASSPSALVLGDQPSLCPPGRHSTMQSARRSSFRWRPGARGGGWLSRGLGDTSRHHSR